MCVCKPHPRLAQSSTETRGCVKQGRRESGLRALRMTAHHNVNRAFCPSHSDEVAHEVEKNCEVTRRAGSVSENKDAPKRLMAQARRSTERRSGEQQRQHLTRAMLAVEKRASSWTLTCLRQGNTSPSLVSTFREGKKNTQSGTPPPRFQCSTSAAFAPFLTEAGTQPGRY